MKLLIIGNYGFIGSHLVKYFVAENEVVGCDLLSVNDPDIQYYQISTLSPDFQSIFKDHNFDICINASGTANVTNSVAYPITDFEANTFAVARILDVIRKFQPQCKFLHISSAAVYGNPLTLPIRINDALQPISPYGYHKLLSEIVCREYYHLFKIPITIIRPFSVYGNGLRKQLLWDICTKLYKAESITLFGTGNESRDFLHISDLIKLVEIIFDRSPFDCNIYNAASGEETSIHKISGIVGSYYSSKKSISFKGEKKAGDPVNWRADIESIRQIGFQPLADLKTSVFDYINWFNTLHDQ